MCIHIVQRKNVAALGWNVVESNSVNLYGKPTGDMTEIENVKSF